VATKTVKKKAARAKSAKVVALKVPDFRSESEEADWWYANRDLVEDLLDKHGRRVGNGIDLEVELVKPPTKAISIRLAEPDIKRAKALAARKGVGYQTYIRSVLHEALHYSRQNRSWASSKWSSFARTLRSSCARVSIKHCRLSACSFETYRPAAFRPFFTKSIPKSQRCLME
jgi:predicted DNA binding CopG/RHH family protein